MSSTDLVDFLGSVDIFSGLSSRVLSRVAEAGREATYPAGSPVVEQGESVAGYKAFSSEGVEMHVVLSGNALVVVNGETVNELVRGAYFGELSLIDGGPRSADVVSGPDGLTTFALSKWTFNELLEKHPEIAVPLLRVVVARLRAREAHDTSAT